MVGPATGNALPVNYQLGEYAIQAILGQGGFGITYLAKDTRLNTLVAIKEYFPQAYAVRTATATIQPHSTSIQAENYDWGLGEFLKEAQALAKFKHPHIVRVLRFLEENNTAYMVMEYEEGESLLSYLKRHGGFLAEPTLLSIFIPVLTGLQAVHDAGLLHLDIKPDNIYLRKDAQPMLIDFGSSRQTREDASASQKVTISRGYAAPEQYPRNGERGPWSDVYGVGASLYRCITSREPMDSLERKLAFEKKRMDMLAPAGSFDHPRYAPHIRAAVDAALTLNADDRPRSARALQNGLMGKGLRDDQVKPFVAYGRGTGFIGVTQAVMQISRRRIKRGFVEKLIAVSVFAAAMAITIPKLMIDTGHLSETEVYGYVDDAESAVRSIPRRLKQFIDQDVLGGKPAPVQAAVVRPRPRPAATVEKPIPPFEVGKQLAHTLSPPVAPKSLAFLLQGRLLACALGDGTVQLWNADNGQLARTFAARAKTHAVVAASSDGNWLAYTGADHALQLWNAAEDKALEPMRGHADTVNAIAFSADGKLLATGGEDLRVIVWDLENGKALRTLASRAAVLALTFAPNGRMLAAADVAGAIQSWEIPGGGDLAYTLAQDDALTTLAYSPDGKWLATAGQQNFVKLWRVGVERDDRVFKNAPEITNAIAFSPDGKWVLLGGMTEAIEIRNAETGEVANRLAGHQRAVRALAVSADGQALATADDSKVRVWR
jgi:sugar lactone lactonase YvrE